MTDAGAQEIAIADHRDDAYWEDDILILRASSLGGCTRALIQTGMGIQGEEPPADIKKRWAQGSAWEKYCLDSLRVSGWNLLDEYAGHVKWDHTGQPLVELSVGPYIKIRCHPDAIAQCYIHGKGYTEFAELKERRVVEAKCLRPSFPRDFEPYRWQMSVEMAGTGLLGLWVYGEKEDCEHCFGDVPTDGCGRCYSTGAIVRKVEFVPQDVAPYSLVDIKKRALHLYRAIMDRDAGECSTKQFPCAFYTDPDALCSREQRTKVEEFPAEILEEVRVEVTRLTKARVELEAPNKVIEDAKARIKKLVEGLDVKVGTKFGLDDVTVTKKQGALSLDKAKVKAAGIDLAKYKTRGADTWEVR